MYTGGTTASNVGKKQRPSTGYLVRPKLGALRSLYSSRPLSAYAGEKRKKVKKSSLPKMDWRKRPDYADTAYREAVGRLRILLAESYTPIKRPLRELDSAGEETDNQSQMSGGSRNSKFGRHYYYHYPLTPRRYFYPSLRTNYSLATEPDKHLTSSFRDPPPKLENSSTAPPELMAFIERQEEYIEQLEKESRFCRDELASLLSKVKDVISENENLHERQKSKLIKSVFDHLETETETETEVENRNKLKSPKKSKKTVVIEGPAIVYESRISELEAQLTQARIDLKKALDENESYRKKINDGTILETVGYESYRKQLDNLERENKTLQETIHKLQNALAISRDKEHDTTDKVKRSLDVAEQAQYEKNAAESEIRRLKDELERQHLKLRDAIAEQSRRIADERTAVERRYTQQIEQLTTELGVQWETTNKLQLELDKQRRDNSDLRRETAQKQALIDELRKEMQNKIITLQSDIGVSGAEKTALEQQISTLQMANERSERQNKQEIVRLQAEISSLRQRLDRADADLIHSRRENLRLSEQVASLEKEITLDAVLSEEKTKIPRGNEAMALPPPSTKNEEREKELSSMIKDMENKHANTITELENMIHSQNQLMDKLSNECHALTQKLEDASIRHKEEIQGLQTNLEYLNNKIGQTQLPSTIIKDEGYVANSYQRPPAKLQHPTGPSPSLTTPATQPPIPEQKPQDDLNRTIKREPSKSNVLSTPAESKPIEAFPTEEYDPNQQYPPDQQQYDPSQQYDPNQQYDPDQQYDRGYDPNQEYPGYDPGQQYDPSQQYDPNLQTYEGDPNQYQQGQAYETDPSTFNQEYASGDQHEANLADSVQQQQQQ